MANVNETNSDYNPYEHRNDNIKAISDWQACMHFTRSVFGYGMLIMPLSYSQAGLAFGVACTVLIATLVTYCMHILVKSSYELCCEYKIPSLTYAGVAQIAFRKGPECLRKLSEQVKFGLDCILIFVYLGACSIYVIFIASNLKQVVDFHTKVKVDLRVYMVSLIPPLLLMNLVKSWRYLAFSSLLANFLLLTSMSIIFYYVFVDLPKLSSDANVIIWKKMPIFFGSTIFSFTGIGAVLPLENSMKTPEHFIRCPSVLWLGMTFVASVYTTVGFFGFLKYGKTTKSSITLNLPQHEDLAQSAKLMSALSIFLSYSVQFYIPMEIIWKYVLERYGPKGLCIEYMVRDAIILVTVGAAIAIPNLAGFTSLVGTMCLSFISIIFPAVIELVTFYEKQGLKWLVLKDTFLIMFGLLSFAAGTYASIRDIYDNYQEDVH